MVRDGEASRRRLLAAAAAEFAQHGIVGARVDRIAASSGVNKAQMYAWFGSKDGLFDAVFDDQLHGIVDSVPFDADDLPGYAVRLYDSYLAAPELVRLASWNRLERVPTGDLLSGHRELSEPKNRAIARAQEQGRILAGIRPDEVYSLVIALAGTWSPVSATYTASAADGGADHERRRAALRLVVTRALGP
ncbi:TetR family transcriptional regulator [Nakamurella flavida]|uniref:TetR family transcriptional regulator n=1 Tax=Nakamurella flavida TaxID=363630 RepID=A0A938YNF9_9ACTN|nr:TetR family transcriptional regulator [Nakamurella flavida]MBM9477948.1 TetR family transcriptional regulator [Nakamurella flavida]MDP9778336.1 AcrR family transcriptional regulator [Nakamurella flavida]